LAVYADAASAGIDPLDAVDAQAVDADAVGIDSDQPTPPLLELVPSTPTVLPVAAVDSPKTPQPEVLTVLP